MNHKHGQAKAALVWYSNRHVWNMTRLVPSLESGISRLALGTCEFQGEGMCDMSDVGMPLGSLLETLLVDRCLHKPVGYPWPLGARRTYVLRLRPINVGHHPFPPSQTCGVKDSEG